LRIGFGTGLLLALVAAVIWGTQFPVAKSAFPYVDAFHLTASRYAIGVLLLLAWLVRQEGLQALRYEGRGRHAAWIGLVGMTGSPSLVFAGLMLSRPEVIAVIVATQPAMTALAEWRMRGRRPARFTLACVAVAFVGVVTVVTRWSVTLAPHGLELVGDLMALAGAFCWVVYTMATERFRGWSVLRFTTLTMLPGVLANLVLAGALVAAGVIAFPAGAAWQAAAPQLAYLAVVGVVASMVMWNAGTQRIGALNAVLFLNLIPLVTFFIGWLQGARFAPIELAGAAAVIGALVANNLYLRRARAAPTGAAASRGAS